MLSGLNHAERLQIPEWLVGLSQHCSQQLCEIATHLHNGGFLKQVCAILEKRARVFRQRYLERQIELGGGCINKFQGLNDYTGKPERPRGGGNPEIHLYERIATEIPRRPQHLNQLLER